MPIPAPVNKTAKPDVYGVDFSIKPGETRFDLTYSVPYTEGAPYQGKILTQDDDTYLIAPNGITLQGDNLKDMGTEPRTQAHIYGLTGTTYQIQLTGTEAAPPADAAAADQPESGGSQIEQIMPRVNRMTVGILALALGILALGVVLLDRANPAGAPKELKARGRQGRRVEVLRRLSRLARRAARSRTGSVPGADRAQRGGEDHPAASRGRILPGRTRPGTDLRQRAARNRHAPANGIHRPWDFRVRRTLGPRRT